MEEMDKGRFGEFLAEQRKAKGYTQKELAEKIFVSNKAISKWETGNGMPDVSMLIPLSEALGVTVTELLEGRKMEPSAELDTGQVETLVKKALEFSEETPKQQIEKRRKRGLFFAGLVLVMVLEFILLQAAGHDLSDGPLTELAAWELFCILFGAYFWIYAKEKLPGYYDENKISAYSDGPFRMNLPGVRFNNSNWPYILKTGRIWCAAGVILLPILAALADVLGVEEGRYIILVLYLGGLFIPMTAVAKKYE